MRRRNLTDDQIISLVGIQSWEAAQAASLTVRGKSLTHWMTVLSQAATRNRSADRLRKMVATLDRGQDINSAELYDVIGRLETGNRQLVPLDEIVPAQVLPVRCGYQPLDYHLGGLPELGLVVVGGGPGTGKTRLATTLGASFARAGKTFDFFSLEMTSQQIAYRFAEEASLSKAQKKRIRICDEILSPWEISTVAARAGKTDCICIDFAELLVESEMSEQVMGVVYRTLAMTAKRLKVPVILLSQLNRDGYNGGIPKLNNLRYSGAAEIYSTAVFLVYNPTAVWVSPDQSGLLPVVENSAYLIAAKSRFGYGRHKSPGAILCDWTPEGGWQGTTSDRRWKTIHAV